MQLIFDVANKIVEKLNPEKIILFGSHARGDANEYSDLDILVVMKTDLPRFKRAGLVSNLIRPRFFSADFKVYTPFEFGKAEKNLDPWFDIFIKEVLEDGKILYDGKAK